MPFPNYAVEWTVQMSFFVLVMFLDFKTRCSGLEKVGNGACPDTVF